MNGESYERDMSLSEMLRIMYEKKWLILSGGFFAAIISLAIALSLPNKYQSSSTLVIAKDPNEGLGAMASSMGGLAGLAGVDLQSGQAARNAMIAKELLKSQRFIVDFIHQHNIAIPLLAGEEWNKFDGKLLLDSEIYDSSSNKWVANLESGSGKYPLEEDLHREFSDIFSVSEDPKTDAVNMSIEFLDPRLSQEWLSLLIERVNSYVKRRDQQQAKENIRYLNRLTEEATSSSLKQTFYNLIEEQTKTLMLTEVQDEYVFQIIDPPNYPEKKSSPRRAVIMVVGTVLGGFITIFFVIVFSILRNNKVYSLEEKGRS